MLDIKKNERVFAQDLGLKARHPESKPAHGGNANLTQACREDLQAESFIIDFDGTGFNGK